MRVLIIGGTGTLGRPTAIALARQGATVRLLSRRASPGASEFEQVRGDVVTGEGLAVAMQDVDVVVHAAHDPTRPARDLAGVRNVVAATRDAKAQQLVYVSIVGAAAVPSVPFYRAKAQGERLVANAPVRSSTFRASQFHEFVSQTLRRLDRLPILPVPAGARFQPVAVAEVAAALTRHVLHGGPDTLVGPEVLDFEDLVEAWQSARGRTRRVVPFSLPHPALRALAAGALTSPDAPRSVQRWSEWLLEAEVTSKKPPRGTERPTPR
ncbi:SDR family oxidoreductase [Deinococcus yavapaiensis]|uniref:Uncharacterized protein YbjT (DUF2867 family) n=1 Tax=Deinococcus yavapaiensis KR-236 TaxID=694435 RepID=A0A318S3M7_9DEIO|nr:NAD(P)H-binding protein [Deinococcus yavapaiensis]PYE53118.1 uncharacterized protein YbjT (DUF2867 family) [Deinococcus yavapaiensis KR-236]